MANIIETIGNIVYNIGNLAAKCDINKSTNHNIINAQAAAIRLNFVIVTVEPSASFAKPSFRCKLLGFAANIVGIMLLFWNLSLQPTKK